MKKIRTFIAHPVPEQWKTILREALPGLRSGLKSRIGWVRPENMHFTLKFLGDVPENDIPVLHAALKQIPFTPFLAEIGNPGFFPGPDKPRIIWMGMAEGAREFCRSVEAVDRELGRLQFERNKKECHAHLTLGRVKRIEDDDWVKLAGRLNEIELPPARIDSFKLYSSKLTPEGPIYSVLHEYQ